MAEAMECHLPTGARDCSLLNIVRPAVLITLLSEIVTFQGISHWKYFKV
jgi:hypothetical protein